MQDELFQYRLMQTFCFQFTKDAFEEFLHWAKRSGITSLKWMSFNLDETLHILSLEQPVIDVEMQYQIEVDDDDAVLIQLQQGTMAEKTSLKHQAGPQGRAIMAALEGLLEGRYLTGPEARVYHQWACWSDHFADKFKACSSLDDFQDIVFGPKGLVEAEIEEMERLKGFYVEMKWEDQRKANGLIARWNTIDLGLEIMKSFAASSAQ